MKKLRTVVDATADKKGNIIAVKFNGNKNFTPINKAIKIVEKGQFKDLTVVHPKVKKSHLRSKPDGNIKNNLDEMAKNKS